MIGAGVAGLSVAWLLVNQGHRVTLVDPALPQPLSQPGGSGTGAALGLLMAQVYRRSSGRGWRLRQQSLALWRAWRELLEQRGESIPFRSGLLQLASSPEELEAQQRLAQQRQQQGLPLRLLERSELEQFQPGLPEGALGGLLSEQDGQIDPIPALTALLKDGRRHGLELEHHPLLQLERCGRSRQGRWLLHTSARCLESEWVVMAAGLASAALLRPLGHEWPMSPVLGQALELQLPPQAAINTWPGSVSWNGVNLVPRPQGRLWLGATLEPGQTEGDPHSLEVLRQLGGDAPEWLLQAEVLQQWQGLRARPEGRPAPLLEELEPGLLLNSGHYRNGVLLAPACAAWVAEKIEQVERAAAG